MMRVPGIKAVSIGPDQARPSLAAIETLLDVAG
jgi:hypothetical protein